MPRDDRGAACWWGSRTSAAPASRARSASRRRAPGLGADLDLDAVPLRERGHGGVRDPHVRVAGTDARDRRARPARRRPRGLRRVGPGVGRRSATLEAGRHAPCPSRGRRGRRGPGPVPRRRRARVRTARSAPDAWPTTSDERSRGRAVRRRAGARRSSRCSVRRTSPASAGCSSSTTRIVQGQTVAGPGRDAAVVRLEGTLKAVAAVERRQRPVRPPRSRTWARRTRSPRRRATSPHRGASRSRSPTA